MFPRILVGLCATAAVVCGTATAQSQPLLHQGSRGQRVAALQWLLAGGKPSAYTGIRTLGRADVDGVFGEKTARAVVEMKTRLGFPDRALDPVAGADLFDILKGVRPRPIGYLVRATQRLAAEKEIERQTAASRCAHRLIDLERSQIGVHEIPNGSNRGPHISLPFWPYPSYQSATGAYGLAWCASFQAWAYRIAHVGFPAAWDGFIGSTMADSAGVFAIVRNAQARGWLRAIPQPGFLSAWTDRLGHIGLVERVSHAGYTTIEGNASNSVLERFHPFGSRPVVFIALPGCDG